MSASMDALMEKIRVAREAARSSVPFIPDSVVKDAVAHALIQANVSIEPTGIAICHDGKDFRMYSADAWTEPSERGFLPWSPPDSKWAKLAVVQADGTMVVVDRSVTS